MQRILYRIDHGYLRFLKWHFKQLAMNTEALDQLLSKFTAKQKLQESISLDEQHSEILEDKSRWNKRAREALKNAKLRETWFSLGRESFVLLPNDFIQSSLVAEEPELYQQIESIQKKLPEKRRRLEVMEEEVSRLTEELLASMETQKQLQK
ncbi:hypothetical protein GpartN1_g2276.t1 [Galdieria partita]|uniref:Uncharacterized protein n=1 Tax=Galdieria partita TaxID=83374 RepID=A0A9C7PU68_9RHOD|nr:hypothetical protein GpartN1_g2276.t1 [Galdieria partita]